MKMRGKMVLLLSAACALLMVPAISVSAQTVTIDSEGPEYSGDYLLTVNTNTKIDYAAGNSEGKDTALNASWENTGITGASGPSGAAENDTLGTSSARSNALNSTYAEVLTRGASRAEGLTLDSWMPAAGSGISSLSEGDDETEDYAVGDTKKFTSASYYGAASGTMTEFTAECVAVTDSCTLWYHNNDKVSQQWTKEEVAGMAESLQVCAEKQLASFGDSDRIDYDGDGRVAFVFYPLGSSTEGGFFSIDDLYNNGMDMVNVNSSSTHDGKLVSSDFAFSVLVHEWQHLINYSQTGGWSNVDRSSDESFAKGQFLARSYTWLNESFSQSAIELNGKEPGMIGLQVEDARDFSTLYGNALTMPFVFDGIYVPRENPLSSGVYVNWYLFSRYLSAQTEGYAGGGDEIYKTVFNCDRGSFTYPGTDQVETNVGKCDDATLEKALTSIGYLGTGEKAKAKDLNEMLRNFVLATYLREDSGVYSLGGYGKFDLSSLNVANADTVAETPQKLPGGYSACLTKTENGSLTVDENNTGADIEHYGITVTYDGITADVTDSGDGTLTYDFSTADTGTTICYTTNGTDPELSFDGNEAVVENGTIYDDDAVTVKAGTVVKAVDADRWGTSAVWSSNESQRISGEDRYATMAAIVKKTIAGSTSTSASTIVLASGDSWPDALAASSLAGTCECPVVLTEGGKLSAQSASLLKALGTVKVIIVGGKSAVSEDVETALKDLGIKSDGILRFGGEDRTQTADRTENAVMILSDADTCIICSGQNFPDALSVSAYAYANKMPILLTDESGKLTDESLALAKKFKKVIIAGGTGAVSGGVETQLADLSVQRIGGGDRYATSAEIINKLYGTGIPTLAIATGENFPDALSGAALAGRSSGAILLVNGTGTSLTADESAILGRTRQAYILGGTSAVSAGMEAAVNAAMK